MAFTRLRNIDGRGAALITGLSIVPALALLLDAGDAQDLADLVPDIGVVSYTLVLGAAVLTYLHWRTSSVGGTVSDRLSAWLVVGLTAGAMDGLLQVAALHDGQVGSPSQWPTISRLTLLALLCVVAACAERVDVPADPALVGALAATALVGAHVLTSRSAPPLLLDESAAALLNTTVMLTGLALAWILLHRTQVSLWARRRLALSTVLLTAAQCVTTLEPRHPVVTVATMVASLLGALVLCTMAQHLLRSSVLAHQAELDQLHRSLEEVRAAVLEDRELLHEVGATLAGISTASQVMRQGHAVPAHRRQRLEAMLVAELARLERLMLARSSVGEGGPDAEIDLDAVVEPLVVSHQARGREVSWSPTGRRAYGDPDELAELVNILLENAARHARGSDIQLSVDQVDGGIVATCSDAGPGVPAELRERLFDPEVRRPDSPGQGLGLAIAHRLATARGGSLELVDVGRPGATFVARLPRKEPLDDAALHVA